MVTVLEGTVAADAVSDTGAHADDLVSGFVQVITGSNGSTGVGGRSVELVFRTEELNVLFGGGGCKAPPLFSAGDEEVTCLNGCCEADECACEEGFYGPLCADRSVCVSAGSGGGNLSDARLGRAECQTEAAKDGVVCHCTNDDRKSQVRRHPLPLSSPASLPQPSAHPPSRRVSMR